MAKIRHQKCFFFFGLFDTAHEIMLSISRFAAKTAGKAPYARWAQQQALKDALTRTKGCQIIHNVNDGFWGQDSKGEGINAYGICLEQLRILNLSI